MKHRQVIPVPRDAHDRSLPPYLRAGFRVSPFFQRHGTFDENGKRIWIFDIYERVSTPKQIKGTGFDRQDKRCRASLDKKSTAIRETHKDVSSGFGESRYGLAGLFQAIDDGLINGVIFDDLTRLARKGKLVKKLLRRLLRRSFRVISVDEGLDITKATPSILNLAAYIVDKKTKNLAATMYNSPRNHKTGSDKYGLIWDKTTCTYRPDEKTFYVIQIIFDKSEKLSPFGIAKYLNGKNIPSPREKAWGKSTVQRYLNDEAYHPFLRPMRKEDKTGWTVVSI